MKPFIITALLVLTSGLASAHGRLAETYEVLWHPTDPDMLAINTTFGLVLTRDGGTSWRWVCREAMNVSLVRDPPFLLGDEAAVGATFDGLVLGTLDGCTWTFPTPELERIVTIDLIRHPTRATTMLALTSSGGDFDNLLYRSDDSGFTWRPTSEPIEPILFEKVRVAPSNPSRVYLSGSYPRTPENPERRPFVHRSDDDGATWERIAFPFRDGDRNVFLMAVDPDDADVLYARVSHEADRPELNERLTRSEDGGESWEDLFELPDLRAFAFSDDGRTIWIGGRGADTGVVVDAGFVDGGVTIGDGRGLWRSVDGGPFESVRDDVSIGCLHVRGDELWACGWSFTDGFAVGRSTDEGRTFTPVFDFPDLLGPVQCEGEVPTTCMRADQDIIRDLGLPCEDGGPCPERPDAGVDAGGGGMAGGGCGCDLTRQSTPAFGWLGVALAVVALLRLGRRGQV